jgi:hypothetical protein
MVSIFFTLLVNLVISFVTVRYIIEKPFVSIATTIDVSEFFTFFRIFTCVSQTDPGINKLLSINDKYNSHNFTLLAYIMLKIAA